VPCRGVGVLTGGDPRVFPAQRLATGSGKPLAPILGLPMIQHVYHRTAMCGALHGVIVATCDQEIAHAARGFGAEVVMTSPAHERASDRMAEVAEGQPDVDIWVLVQGDEPMIVPDMIDLALRPIMEEPDVVCVNLGAQVVSAEEFEDRNCIKVVIGRDSNALFFSREPIPTRQRLEFGALDALKQVCVIPFRRAFLLAYSRLEPSPLEQAESIDMLRALEYGYSVRIVRSPFATKSVDTPEDLREVESLMQVDRLVGRYARGRQARA
jgi:3-deoxy-manno-octulosonate cytidylyltransferase (CMP-KDO synthetase)